MKLVHSPILVLFLTGLTWLSCSASLAQAGEWDGPSKTISTAELKEYDTSDETPTAVKKDSLSVSMAPSLDFPPDARSAVKGKNSIMFSKQLSDVSTNDQTAATLIRQQRARTTFFVGEQMSSEAAASPSQRPKQFTMPPKTYAKSRFRPGGTSAKPDFSSFPQDTFEKGAKKYKVDRSHAQFNADAPKALQVKTQVAASDSLLLPGSPTWPDSPSSWPDSPGSGFSHWMEQLQAFATDRNQPNESDAFHVGLRDSLAWLPEWNSPATSTAATVHSFTSPPPFSSTSPAHRDFSALFAHETLSGAPKVTPKDILGPLNKPVFQESKGVLLFPPSPPLPSLPLPSLPPLRRNAGTPLDFFGQRPSLPTLQLYGRGLTLDASTKKMNRWSCLYHHNGKEKDPLLFWELTDFGPSLPLAFVVLHPHDDEQHADWHQNKNDENKIKNDADWYDNKNDRVARPEWTVDTHLRVHVVPRNVPECVPRLSYHDVPAAASPHASAAPPHRSHPASAAPPGVVGRVFALQRNGQPPLSLRLPPRLDGAVAAAADESPRPPPSLSPADTFGVEVTTTRTMTGTRVGDKEGPPPSHRPATLVRLDLRTDRCRYFLWTAVRRLSLVGDFGGGRPPRRAARCHDFIPFVPEGAVAA